MKCGVYGPVDAGMLRRSAGMVLSLLVVASVAASPPRMLGKKAVMHVYSYAPKTLEITSVTSLFFKDVDACESAVGGALSTATSRATEGDLVDAQCVAIDPPEPTLQPEETHLPEGVTAL